MKTTIAIERVTQRFRRTGDECPFCEEEAIVKDEQKVEKFCSNCHTVLSKQAQWSENEDTDLWTRFHRHRRETGAYSGWTGPDRIKFPGGFAGVYEFEKDF